MRLLTETILARRIAEEVHDVNGFCCWVPKRIGLAAAGQTGACVAKSWFCSQRGKSNKGALVYYACRAVPTK